MATGYKFLGVAGLVVGVVAFLLGVLLYRAGSSAAFPYKIIGIGFMLIGIASFVEDNRENKNACARIALFLHFRRNKVHTHAHYPAVFAEP